MSGSWTRRLTFAACLVPANDGDGAVHAVPQPVTLLRTACLGSLEVSDAEACGKIHSARKPSARSLLGGLPSLALHASRASSPLGIKAPSCSDLLAASVDFATATQQWGQHGQGTSCGGRGGGSSWSDDQPQQSESVVQPWAGGRGAAWAPPSVTTLPTSPTTGATSEKTVAWTPSHLAAGKTSLQECFA